MPAGAGSAAQLAVELDVGVMRDGDYELHARLETMDGRLISDRPNSHSMQPTGAKVSGASEDTRWVRLLFSGEQIRQAGVDGPWQLVVLATGGPGPEVGMTKITPGFRAAQFGESKGAGVPVAVVKRAMLDDPNLLAKVAARNGMTPSRFMGQEEGRILAMVRVYLAERQADPASAASR